MKESKGSIPRTRRWMIPSLLSPPMEEMTQVYDPESSFETELKWTLASDVTA